MVQTERTGGLEKLWTCLRVAASAKAGCNLWKLNHCAASSLNHISLLPWPVTLNLKERILKLWKSTRPFGAKVDKSIFFTPPLSQRGEFTLTLHKLLTIRTWASRSERLRGEPSAESALSSPSPAGIHLG